MDAGDTAESEIRLTEVAGRDVLIGFLYQAATGNERFDRFLSALAAETGSHRAIVQSFDIKLRTGRLPSGYNFEPGLAEDFSRLPLSQNLWLRPNSSGTPFWRGSDAISHSELLAFPQFARFLEAHKIGRTLHIEAIKANDKLLHFVLTRPLGAPDYDESQIETARSISVHAKRAFGIQRTFVRAGLVTDALSNIAEGAGLGLAVIDSACLVFASDSGRRMLDGIGALISSAPASFGEDVALERIRLPRAVGDAISRLRAEEGVTLLVPSAAGDGRVLVQGRSLSGREAFLRGHSTAVALIMYDPDKRPKPNDEILRLVYELTSAEARVSSLLAEGWSIEEMSKQLAVSAHTIRAHLKRTFEKTGATRQAELVKIVLNSARLPILKNVVRFPLRRTQPVPAPTGDVRSREQVLEVQFTPSPLPQCGEPALNSGGGALGSPRLR